MFPRFLPADVYLLTEPASVAFAKRIQRQTIHTPLNGSEPPLRQWAIDTAYVHTDASGVPILLLHGFDSSLLEFRQLEPLLAPHHATWAIDLLGFGFTQSTNDVPINPTTIRQHLYAVWSQLMAKPVVLVGVSMGGAVAIDFTLAHPACVERLVLIDSVGFSGSFPIGRFLFPPLETLAVEWLRLRKQAALSAAAASFSPDLRLIDLIRCSQLHHAMPGWDRATIAFTKSGGYSDIAPNISQIQHPTLILWGEADDVLGTEDADKFARAIVGSQLIWIPQCGHVPPLEQPTITAQHILNFCNFK